MLKRWFGFIKPKIEFNGWKGEVVDIPPPEQVTIPVSRPGRMPFNPVVEVGEKVNTGQFIAMLPSRTGAHSTVTGTVVTIGPGYFWTGDKVLCITIRRESEDEFEKREPAEDFLKLSKEELVEAMAELGFAAPWKPKSLQDKLSDEELNPVHTVIIRAVDNEPPISVQRRFLTEFSKDFADSVQGIRKIAQDARIVVAVPKSLETEARSILKDVEIFPVGKNVLDTNPRLLIYKITGRFFNLMQNPRDYGIAVISAENVAFVGYGLRRGIARIDKLVTISAPELDHPITVRVRIGTPVSHVLEHLNIKIEDGYRIVFGGPLTGVAQPDTNSPITLGVNGVMVIPKQKVIHLSDSPCTNCGKCVHICPVNIEVNLVGRYVEFGFFEEAVIKGAGSCIECGLCAYVCPAKRPLMQYMRLANREFSETRKEEIQQGEE